MGNPKPYTLENFRNPKRPPFGWRMNPTMDAAPKPNSSCKTQTSPGGRRSHSGFQELSLSCYIEETILITIYIYIHRDIHQKLKPLLMEENPTVGFQELSLSYYIQEAMLITIYIYIYPQNSNLSWWKKFPQWLSGT